MSENYIIETDGLTKNYKRWFSKGTCALNNLSIQVPYGSIFGFLGPNGAGKTTTIKILMDLIKASSGSAKILGEPNSNVKIKEKIGFLPDAPAFYPQLSTTEFLNICAKLFHMDTAKRNQRIEKVLEEVKMTEHRKGRLGSFSRGMLQRVGVAQALLNDPSLLILDEPLLGLDPFGRQEFKDIILNQKKKGTSIFFSSHILSDIEEICDHIAILNKGNLICTGTLDELLTTTKLKFVIPEKLEDVFKEYATDAEEITRNSDGDRILTFKYTDALKKKLKETELKYPNDVQILSGHEKLEKFFFRCLKGEEQ
ncbi:MAG: ABC transporter ATP-binding protein [Lentisphaeria bacterium]